MKSAELFFERFEAAYARANERGTVTAECTNRRWWFNVGSMQVIRRVNDPRDHPNTSYEFEMDDTNFYLARMKSEKQTLFTWLMRAPNDLQLAELKLVL